MIRSGYHYVSPLRVLASLIQGMGFNNKVFVVRTWKKSIADLCSLHDV